MELDETASAHSIAATGITPGVRIHDLGETGQASNPDKPGLLFVRKLDGSQPVFLGDYGGLAMSPDGKFVAAWDPAYPIPHDESLILIPTGTGEPRQLKRGALRIVTVGGFSSDGRRLIVNGREKLEEPDRVWIQDFDGQAEPRPITRPGRGSTTTHNRCRRMAG